jgi:hypothetical protein
MKVSLPLCQTRKSVGKVLHDLKVPVRHDLRLGPSDFAGTFSEWPFLGQKVVDSSGDLSEAVCETRKRNAIN